MSSTEPLTGNTFSSFREQQNHGGISESANRVDDHATKGAFRNGGNANDPMDRWSVSSFPGQPIVPSEVYRQAVSSEISTNGAAFNSPRKSGKSRPLPIPAPISTRSPIEVQSEYGTATGYMEDRATNLAMGDVSATAKVRYHLTSYLSPWLTHIGFSVVCRTRATIVIFSATFFSSRFIFHRAIQLKLCKICTVAQ